MRDGAANTGRTRVGALARRGAWLLIVPLALAAILIASRGRQSFASDPVALNGSWAPFSRCPVDDPAMLAVDGQTNILFCIAAESTSGSIKLGNTSSTTGSTKLQFGLVGSSAAGFAVIPPAGGAIEGAPVVVPGGLLGLACPSPDPLVIAVCNLITSDALNTVTATVESAGTPTNFSLAGGALLNVPIVTMPVKVHLENPLLGSTCYIGSDADPIILQPRNTNISQSTLTISRFDADGTADPNGPLSLISVTGLTQGDDTFAVPAASGCGTAGLLDSTINSKEGLPSPSGNNNVVLNNASSFEAGLVFPSTFAPTAGQEFSNDWHAGAAAAPTPCPGTCPTPSPVPTATPVPPPSPTLIGAASGGASTTITGSLAATPGKEYTIKVYSSTACDASGSDAQFLASTDVTTDGSGNASFGDVLNAVAPAGQSLSATASDAGATSSFSPCVTVSARGCTDDSDCDGYTDAAEIGAAQHPFTYCSVMRADVNNDGTVNILDLSNTANKYAEMVPPAPARYDQGPPPFDDAVNVLDLAKIAGDFTRTVQACP